MGGARSVELGYIAGVFGVRGWVKIHSFTDPRENCVAHRRWTLTHHGQSSEVEVEAGQAHGKNVIAKLAGIDDADAAGLLIGARISVPRDALPACGPGEYYWADLEGLSVRDRAGHELGRVVRLMETGAHDVLVLDGKGDRLIPFVLDEIVESVSLDEGTITVNWDAGFWDD